MVSRYKRKDKTTRSEQLGNQTPGRIMEGCCPPQVIAVAVGPGFIDISAIFRLWKKDRVLCVTDNPGDAMYLIHLCWEICRCLSSHEQLYFS